MSVKRLAELALACILLESWSQSVCPAPCALCGEFGRALPRWRRFLIEQCEDQRYAEYARKVPARGLDALLPYLALRSGGYRYDFHEESLRRLESSGLLDLREREAYRFLEAQWILWRAGWSVAEPDWKGLFMRTSLARRRRLSYIDTISVYAATHSVFYITDFGDRALGELADLRGEVTEFLTCSLVHYWRLHHWDLVGECLLALACLNTERRSLAVAAEGALARRWWEGRLPATSRDEEACRQSETTLGAEERFRSCYHSSLIGILVAGRTHHNDVLSG